MLVKEALPSVTRWYNNHSNWFHGELQVWFPHYTAADVYIVQSHYKTNISLQVTHKCNILYTQYMRQFWCPFPEMQDCSSHLLGYKRHLKGCPTACGWFNIFRHCLTSIQIPIIKMRWLCDHLIFTIGMNSYTDNEMTSFILNQPLEVVILEVFCQFKAWGPFHTGFMSS